MFFSPAETASVKTGEDKVGEAAEEFPLTEADEKLKAEKERLGIKSINK